VLTLGFQFLGERSHLPSRTGKLK